MRGSVTLNVLCNGIIHNRLPSILFKVSFHIRYSDSTTSEKCIIIVNLAKRQCYRQNVSKTLIYIFQQQLNRESVAIIIWKTTFASKFN